MADGGVESRKLFDFIHVKERLGGGFEAFQKKIIKILAPWLRILQNNVPGYTRLGVQIHRLYRIHCTGVRFSLVRTQVPFLSLCL